MFLPITVKNPLRVFGTTNDGSFISNESKEFAVPKLIIHPSGNFYKFEENLPFSKTNVLFTISWLIPSGYVIIIYQIIKP